MVNCCGHDRNTRYCSECGKRLFSESEYADTELIRFADAHDKKSSGSADDRLTSRAMNVICSNRDVRTWKDVERKSDAEWLANRNCGFRCLGRIRELQNGPILAAVGQRENAG